MLEKYGIIYVPIFKGEFMARKPIPRYCPVCEKQFFLVRGRTKAHSCSDCYHLYRPLYNLVHAAKYRAIKSGVKFDLDIHWAIRQPRVCPKTNLPMSYADNGANYGTRNPLAASIDKIDSKGGYTQDNCQIVSWWYNVSKQDFKEDKIIDLCRAVVNTFDMKAAQNA